MPPAPIRPGTSLGARAAGRFLALGRWGRQSMSRSNLLAGLKTLSWLVPLTLLIWIYAEREQIDKADNISIPIEIQSVDYNKHISLQMEDKNVVAELSGPRSQLEEIRQKLLPQGDRPSVVLRIDPPLGQYNPNTADLLNASPIFAHTGVTISNCKPASLPIFVDEFVERDVDVQAPPSVSNLVKQPIFDPKQVKIRAPQREMDRIESSGRLVAYADMASTGVLDKPGNHEAVVRVTSPGLNVQDASYNPANVSANFDVRQSDVQFTIPSVVVNLEGPNYLLNKYEVQYKDTIYDVKVMGPPDKIAALQRDDTTKPYGILHVTGDDRPTPTSAGQHTRRLEFKMPDGVRLDPQDDQRSIDFTLVERPTQQ
ncbi:MAG TPA: hypothetical protein VGF52_05860 [Tepidisphaeraceae bacterium]